MDKLWWIFQIILIILKLMHIITVSWLIERGGRINEQTKQKTKRVKKAQTPDAL